MRFEPEPLQPPNEATLSDRADRDLIANDLDSTLIVEAAAGTGKTTQLVRRIVRTIEDSRAAVTEIACVTFTEKAAGELKLRLRESLERARAAADRSFRTPAIAERLNAAIQQLEEAQVSTIHGFCADLLRERPIEAQIDPLFVVLTEAQARRLYDVAFDEWFQQQLTDPPAAIVRSLHRPVFAGFGVTSVREQGPIDRLRNAGWELIQWRDFTGEWHQPQFDRAARVDQLVDRLREFAMLSSEPESRYDGLHFDTQAARQLLEELERTETVMKRDYDRLEAALVDLSRNRQFQRARKGTGKSYKAGVSREQVARNRDELQGELDRFEVDANADLAALLCRELRACSERYEKEKQKAGALDFLDLLLKARNLLVHDEGVRRSFQHRFKRIFVDEFQDTDPLQAEILLLLAADDPSVSHWQRTRPVPGKLFMVGDPKQSIYRFRRADVETYSHVYGMLERAGARRVTLRTSFRARTNIQRAINAAFEPVMRAATDGAAAHAGYVPLEPYRPDLPGQPSLVVLPVPEPYGTQRLSNVAIEASLPDAVGAYVDWLIRKSGWKAAEGDDLVPIQARHVCLLFRRLTSYGEDMTRPYVRALEARSIPHLLVGGRSFHNRAEIETLRAALAAIEWPDDELSVFATLRGTLFAISDEDLLEYRHRVGRFHPFHTRPSMDDAQPTIDDALLLLRRLHRSRNHIPVASTISKLLEATRAHVRFALEHGGEQVLANVLHVAELARQYEAEGGISFRGFIEELRAQAEDGQAGEAPILEEGSDGVRMMTVHKAKGLEFPVVILADITAKLQPSTASRYVDADSRTCVIRLAGCSPADLTRHNEDELRREQAEGVRLAYVAATRARDLLVVPAVGDQEREGWIEPLNRAVYPPIEERRRSAQAPGCPELRSKDSVLLRPNGDPALPTTVAPGLHSTSPLHPSLLHHFVWWDPRDLELGAEAPLGIRRSELIVKDVPAQIVDDDLAVYNAWSKARETATAAGAQPSIAAQTVTSSAKTPAIVDGWQVQMIEIARASDRPAGLRFGALVHAALATVPLDADEQRIEQVVACHGRAVRAGDDEVAACVTTVRAVLAHSILERARRAARDGRCRREVPVTLRAESGAIIEGTVDLAFQEDGAWVIVDFKTDEELRRAANYAQQLRLYRDAVGASTGEPAEAVLLRV